MPKIITIDTAVVAQVRLTTDATGAVRVSCDYTLTSAGVAIQDTSEDVTALLSAGDQASALAVYANVVKLLGNAQGVTAVGVASYVGNQPTTPAQPAQRAG